MITSRVFNAPPGGHELFHSSLRRVKVLGVEREGIGVKIISGLLTPSGNEVSYLGVGRLTFDSANPFMGGSSSTTDVTEKIYVLYET